MSIPHWLQVQYLTHTYFCSTNANASALFLIAPGSVKMYRAHSPTHYAFFRIPRTLPMMIMRCFGRFELIAHRLCKPKHAAEDASRAALERVGEAVCKTRRRYIITIIIIIMRLCVVIIRPLRHNLSSPARSAKRVERTKKRMEEWTRHISLLFARPISPVPVDREK